MLAHDAGQRLREGVGVTREGLLQGPAEQIALVQRPDRSPALLGPTHATRIRPTRVDPHLIADVDEQGHLDLGTGLEDRGLRATARGGVTAQPGLGLGDGEVDRARQLHVGGLIIDVEKLDASSDSFIHCSGSASVALGDRQLLVGLGVHEVRVGAVAVEELHIANLGAHRPELLAGAEGAVDHVAVAGAPQLGADERPALAGLDVLKLEDLEDRALDVDVIAVLELVRADHDPDQCRTAPW